ncbi:ABC-F family ATP-binding cassette domain-containing protein [uncultured Tyzzerella sp.]|uniref:ABC-F family ATP-binding cassette domain-containing protein n=1 Tax=uncultured Tyzzerella sp. TaxID=2321398 RepID=UPI002942D30C|nr:ABC-F family ATP-binding cassette domain-containing protein [uncultured Tyzzerella sp.]
MILSCNNINKSFGITNILHNISFNINEKDRVALVGVNGAGKSTLFKIITGEISKDSGDINIPKNTKIGYFSQTLNLNEDNSLFDELLTVFSNIIDMEFKLRELEEKMSISKDDELDLFIKEYDKISTYLAENNSFNYNSRIKGVLKGLGFVEDDFYKQIKFLSGGQKTRIALGKILLEEPDILLLDEPTNHLDILSINWLENFLKAYPKALFIISHDRYFLNKIVTKVIELENTKATIYNGNYNDYSQKKHIAREIMLKHYLNQQKEIKKQEEVIKKLRSYNREKFIKRAESREKFLDKMEKIEKPDNLPAQMRLSLSPKKESGNDVLMVENLSKSFNFNLFNNIYFDIKKGEKVALIGANGIGKTTLIKMIMGQTSIDSGSIKLGSNVEIGYYDQEQQNLNLDKTIFDEISDTYPNLKNEEIRNALAVFVFTGDEVFKQISTLSGGEKGRVALAKIMLSNANLLILDEPTNHLDMVSKEILEDALKNYTGTCVYISHDRFFINNTATKVIELTKNKMNVYLGNYDYYLEKCQQKDTTTENIQPKIISDNKMDWKAQKEAQAEARKKQNAIKKLEEQIEILENKIKQADEQLTLEEVYTNPYKSKEIFEEKTKLEDELVILYDEWENMA